jgi:hypothetical protein
VLELKSCGIRLIEKGSFDHFKHTLIEINLEMNKLDYIENSGLASQKSP